MSEETNRAEELKNKEYYKDFEMNLRSIHYQNKWGNDEVMEMFNKCLHQYAQEQVKEVLEKLRMQKYNLQKQLDEATELLYKNGIKKKPIVNNYKG